MDVVPITPFELLGLAAAAIIGVFIYTNIRARKRTAALPQIAAQLGFDFSGEDRDQHPMAPNLTTSLFDRGDRAKKFSNVMTGRVSGLGTSIFDYRYTSGWGRNSRTWKQTVATFSQDLWLPEFKLRPKGFIDRIADRISLTHRDVDFDSCPEFARRFLLRGPSDAGIRKLFSPALIQFMEALPEGPKWQIEGSSTTLVVYQSDSRVEADIDSYRSFLEETSSIAHAFFASPDALSKPVR